jgi:hypothetical protein
VLVIYGFHVSLTDERHVYALMGSKCLQRFRARGGMHVELV